jgi:hypothetical protein
MKDDPHGKIVAEVLKPVLDSGCDEQAVPRFKRLPLTVMEQHAPPADDDVDFVLFVRRLPIR